MAVSTRTVNPFALDHRQPIVPRPSRSPTLRHSIASLAAGFVASSRDDWTPRSDAIFASPLAQGTAGNQYRLWLPRTTGPRIRSPWLAAKEDRALRTETTINNTRDFAIGRRLQNLPALREIGFAAN